MIHGLLSSLLPFLVVLTVLVFVHELGHYLIARAAGVRVDVFSIGFGPELFGFNDRAGTRWRFSAIPLGGYVAMHGEGDGSEEQDPAVSFAHKSVAKRAAVVIAGPAANFIFAIVVLAGLFMTVGQPYSVPVVSDVTAGSAAERAGLKAGDTILAIDGAAVQRFEDIQQHVQLNSGTPLDIRIRRDGVEQDVTATPDVVVSKDTLGNEFSHGLLGIRSGVVDYRRHGPVEAVGQAAQETWGMSKAILVALGQYIAGKRSTQELAGPVGIAQLSGQVAQAGILPVINLMVILSINLGLINLLPVPMLDGGHLVFFGIEALRGKPLGQRVRDFGFRVGFALVLTLMVFATWNDLRRLQVFDFLQKLMS
jgi:regulator of sigma E protease